MIYADLLICVSDRTASAIVKPSFLKEYTTNTYKPPTPNSAITSLLSSTVTQTPIYLLATFQRKPSSSTPAHYSIPINEFSPLIWSYNAAPSSKAPLGWAEFHGSNHGNLLLNFSSGERKSSVQSSDYILSSKRVHSIGQFIIWMVLIPFFVFLSRYLRSKRNWLMIHIGGMAVSYLGVLAMVVVIAHVVRSPAVVFRPVGPVQVISIFYTVLCDFCKYM
jgi:hypothetical protein